MLCYNDRATSDQTRGFFVPVKVGHNARLIIRNQQGTSRVGLVWQPVDSDPGVVLEANMDRYGNKTLRDLYPITCQVCHNLITGATYDATGEIDDCTQPAKVVGFEFDERGIPANLYAHWGCLRLEPVSRHVFSMPPVLDESYKTCSYCGKESTDRFCSDRCAKMHSRDKADAVNEPLSPAVAALIESLKQLRDANQSEIQKQDAGRDSNRGYSPRQRMMFGGSNVSQAEHMVKIDAIDSEEIGAFVPQNEMGVLFLLGGIIDRIGYRMAYIDGRYPDAVLVSPDKQKVKTELEFNASSFVHHGHNPALCDLVICWNEDAKLGGLPVIELSRYYDRVTGNWNFRSIT